MARIGYARGSTRDQHPEAQGERLKAAGCTRVYVDHGASGAKASRPEWDKCLERLEPGDTLVCVKLDRIGRSVRNLIDVANLLETRGVDLVCLDQPIDTTSAQGKLFFTILAAFAEFERALIIERTKDGLAATAARGRNGGRKARLNESQVTYARQLRAEGKSVREIGVTLAEMANQDKPVSRQTVYRALGMAQLGVLTWGFLG
jgi:DNA invertase Pin-like site-specific DNA recombinase